MALPSSIHRCWVNGIVCLPHVGETVMYGFCDAPNNDFVDGAAAQPARRILIHYTSWRPSLMLLLHPLMNPEHIAQALRSSKFRHDIEDISLQYKTLSQRPEFAASTAASATATNPNSKPTLIRKRYACFRVTFKTLDARAFATRIIRNGEINGIPEEPSLPLDDLERWPIFSRPMPVSDNEPWYYVYETDKSLEPERQFWADMGGSETDLSSARGFPCCWIMWTPADEVMNFDLSVYPQHEPDPVTEVHLAHFTIDVMDFSLPRGLPLMSMDIETRSVDYLRDRFSNPCVKQDSVICISLAISYHPEHDVIRWGKILVLRSPAFQDNPLQDCERLRPHPQQNNTEVSPEIEYFDDEIELICRYFFLARQAGFLLSFNGVQFDFGYLIKRLIQYIAQYIPTHCIPPRMQPWLKHYYYVNNERINEFAYDPKQFAIDDTRQLMVTLTSSSAANMSSALLETFHQLDNDDIEVEDVASDDARLDACESVGRNRGNNRFGLRIWTAGSFSAFLRHEYGQYKIPVLLSHDQVVTLHPCLRPFVSLDGRILTPPVRCDMSNAAGRLNSYFFLAIPGQICLDFCVYIFNRPMIAHQFSLLNLKTVSEVVAKSCKAEHPEWDEYIKMDMDFRDMNRLWLEGDYSDTMHYCYRDARILNRFMLYFAPDIVMLAQKTCTDPYAIMYRGQGIRLSNLRLNYTSQNNILHTVTNGDSALERHKRNERKQKGRKREKYQGAIVLNPTPRLFYGWAPTGDFAGMYPSIMVALGIDPSTHIVSPECEATLLKQGVIIAVVYIRQLDSQGNKPQAPPADGPYDEVMSHVHICHNIDSAEARDQQDECIMGPGVSTARNASNYQRYVSPNDTWHRAAFIDIKHYRSEDSLLYEMVGTNERMVRDLKTTRKNVRSQQSGVPKNSPAWLALESQQSTIKVIMNSLYGGLADQRPILAEVVTACGRYMIVRVAKLWKSLRFIVNYRCDDTATQQSSPLQIDDAAALEARILFPTDPRCQNPIVETVPLILHILYGDTDSVFPELNPILRATLPQAKIIGKCICRMACQHLDMEFVELELEKVIDMALFLTPKIYAFDVQGYVTIKGMASNRRGTPSAISALQANSLKCLFEAWRSVEARLRTSSSATEDMVQYWTEAIVDQSRLVGDMARMWIASILRALLLSFPIERRRAFTEFSNLAEADSITPFTPANFVITMQIAPAYDNPNLAQALCNADRERRHPGTAVLPGSRIAIVYVLSRQLIENPTPRSSFKSPRALYARDWDLVQSRPQDYILYVSHYIKMAERTMEKIFSFIMPALNVLFSWACDEALKMECGQTTFQRNIPPRLHLKDCLPDMTYFLAIAAVPPPASAKKGPLLTTAPKKKTAAAKKAFVVLRPAGTFFSPRSAKDTTNPNKKRAL